MDRDSADELEATSYAAQERYRAALRDAMPGRCTRREFIDAVRAYQEAERAVAAIRGAGRGRTGVQEPGAPRLRQRMRPVVIREAFVRAFAAAPPVNPKRLAFARWLVATGRVSDTA